MDAVLCLALVTMGASGAVPKVGAVPVRDVAHVIRVSTSGDGGAAVLGAKGTKRYALERWDPTTCAAKGRFQDAEYCHQPVMTEILRDGKNAIPILISQITDDRQMSEPVYDFWPPVRVGDLAAFILDGLFLDETETHWTKPPVVFDETCKDAAFVCWMRFKKTHTQRQAQERWLKFWMENRDRVEWDPKSKCFRVADRAGMVIPPNCRDLLLRLAGTGLHNARTNCRQWSFPDGGYLRDNVACQFFAAHPAPLRASFATTPIERDETEFGPIVRVRAYLRKADVLMNLDVGIQHDQCDLSADATTIVQRFGPASMWSAFDAGQVISFVDYSQGIDGGTTMDVVEAVPSNRGQ